MPMAVGTSEQKMQAVRKSDFVCYYSCHENDRHPQDVGAKFENQNAAEMGLWCEGDDCGDGDDGSLFLYEHVTCHDLRS